MAAAFLAAAVAVLPVRGDERAAQNRALGG
jgi:hypothetical protein